MNKREALAKIDKMIARENGGMPLEKDIIDIVLGGCPDLMEEFIWLYNGHILIPEAVFSKLDHSDFRATVSMLVESGVLLRAKDRVKMPLPFRTSYRKGYYWINHNKLTWWIACVLRFEELLAISAKILLK